MPRASSRKALPIGPLLIGIGAVALVVVLYLLFRQLVGGGGDGSGGGQYDSLPAREYADHATAYAGNIYEVVGEYTDQKAFTSKGQLIVFTTEKNDQPLAIFVPASLRDRNLDRGRRYRFIIEIDRNGLAHAVEFGAP